MFRDKPLIPPNRYTGWYSTVSLVETWRHLNLSRIVKVRIRWKSPKLHEINILGCKTCWNCHLSLRHKYLRAKVLSFNRNYFADGTLIVRVHSKIDCNFHKGPSGLTKYSAYREPHMVQIRSWERSVLKFASKLNARDFYAREIEKTLR